ncbi:helix-turn-helix transcriptional regulator [Paenibacillus validus]|uniref:Excisionase family DNA-binding protein n=1 Tax=Paenibacillus validus TaxID=44253 RepID=A0A7X2ZCC2_9BACL|nr:helix-turn-helix transcriptional regulator [Paenibacillus validus]MED4604141.1 helix-turn-helix transcriptional regulator [Paenibacillus validus]MED4609653.1 helix-turn-helix transcriptional regulator [Paenibacillus validus]MUG71506.1 excisionase family DNA-binding protein [Paenibacillus validus]
MSHELSYTTEDIAKILKISKLTVYDLIKKGELPAYRVGRQMRVDADDLERYKARAKGGNLRPAVPQPETVRLDTIRETAGVRPLVITGQDVSLDILTKHIEKRTKSYRPLRSHVGSLDSLIAMYQGQADIVSTHLLDGDTGTYNVPYVRKLLTGHAYVVLNLVVRGAGLYVRRGNPKQILGWADLARDDIRIVNREKGAGARVLLDEQLRLHALSSRDVNGYDDEESNHLGVAGKVASGEADAGVGIERAASMVGVDFIPLIQERYDLVMLKHPHNEEWIGLITEIVRSDAFKKELRSIQGYDLTHTGTVMYEC